jgi:hypothetical protein
LPWRKEWRDFSKNPATALSTKLVDKVVDCLWKSAPILLAARANLGPVKCSAVFSGIETARYVSEWASAEVVIGRRQKELDSVD